DRYKITSSEILSSGTAVIRVDFKYDGGIGGGGTTTLFINDKKVGEGRIEKTCPSRFGGESLDVGMDNGYPVSEEYQSPFAFTGIIKKVEIHISPSNLNQTDNEKLRRAERDTAMAIE